MNVAQLRETLAQTEFDAASAFAICRDVALAWQDPKIPIAQSLDLIVRLVAQKQSLVQAVPNLGDMINDILRVAGLYPYIEDKRAGQIYWPLMRCGSQPLKILRFTLNR